MLFKFSDKINKKVVLAITCLLLIFISIFAFNLRWIVLRSWDADSEESLYATRMGVSYAYFIKNGELGKIIDFKGNSEHPPLIKLLYGIVIYFTKVIDNAEGIIFVSRILSTIFSVFHTMLIFFINPIASIFFALDSWQICYSSTAWLESSTTFFITIAIYSLMLTDGKKWDKYVSISAIGLGLAFASKYSAFVVSFVILYFLAVHFSKKSRYILFYAGLVLITFLLFNPVLWKSPIKNLWESLTFHKFYSGSSALVERYIERFGSNPPIWTQLTSLWTPFYPWKSHFIIFRWDRIIFILGFFGIFTLYLRSRLLFVWFIVMLSFIFIYPIKWPHYNMMFLPILCISAGEFVRQTYINLIYLSYKKITKSKLNNKEVVKEKIKLYEKLSLFVFVIILIFISKTTSRNFKFIPNHARAHNSLGTILTKQNKFEQAEEELKKALGYKPELSVYVHIHLAELYLAQGDTSKAKKELDLALKLESGISDIHRLLGDIYMNQGNINQAIEEYSRMPDKDVKKSTVIIKHLNIGKAYFEQGKYEKAIEMYRKAIKIQPKNATVHSNIGVVYLNQNKLDEAEKEFKKAISLDSKLTKAYRNLGVVYAMKKQFLEAIELWEKALKLSPHDSEIEDYIKRAKKEMATLPTTMAH
jgi:tetratricopeptide (TPR) repeat protein